MKKIIYSPEHPEGLLIDFTSQEIAQRVIDDSIVEEKKLAYETEKQNKENAKNSALAKLKALGLTEEEVKSIL